MDQWTRYQRTLRRRRIAKAAAAWAALITCGVLAAIGLWTVLVIVMTHLS